MLSKRIKTRLVNEHGRHEKDTGSAEVQIALITRQMEELAGHLKKNPKDIHSRRGLLKMVAQRRKLLSYLRKHEPEKHDKLVKKLELKK